MSENLWSILMLTGVFLIWNKYTENDKNFFTIAGLRFAGIALLVFLVFRFRSGQMVNNGSLITGWWGILGLIGWGYLVSALIYLAIRDNILNTVVALLFFLTLNILSKLDLLDSLNPVKTNPGCYYRRKCALHCNLRVAYNAYSEKDILRLQENNNYNFCNWHLLHHRRICSEELVHHLKDTGYTQLGIYLQWHQHAALCTSLLDNRHKKTYKVDLLSKTCRRKFAYHLPCSGYYLLHHLQHRYSCSHL